MIRDSAAINSFYNREKLEYEQNIILPKQNISIHETLYVPQNNFSSLPN